MAKNDPPSPSRDVHEALNEPAIDPDPTEWPDPYNKRPDPRDPAADADEMDFGDAHTSTGATSTSAPPHEADYLNLVTTEGLRSFPLSQVQRMRFLNGTLDQEFREALAVLASSHDSMKKTVSLNFRGDGKRLVKVGYVRLVQLSCRSRMTDVLLGALLDHGRVCEAADSLVDRTKHPEVVTYHEIALPLGPAEEEEWGKGDTATVVPFRSTHRLGSSNGPRLPCSVLRA